MPVTISFPLKLAELLFSTLAITPPVIGLPISTGETYDFASLTYHVQSNRPPPKRQENKARTTSLTGTETISIYSLMRKYRALSQNGKAYINVAAEKDSEALETTSEIARHGNMRMQKRLCGGLLTCTAVHRNSCKI